MSQCVRGKLHLVGKIACQLVKLPFVHPCHVKPLYVVKLTDEPLTSGLSPLGKEMGGGSLYELSDWGTFLVPLFATARQFRNRIPQIFREKLDFWLWFRLLIRERFLPSRGYQGADDRFQETPHPSMRCRMPDTMLRSQFNCAEC